MFKQESSILKFLKNDLENDLKNVCTRNEKMLILFLSTVFTIFLLLLCVKFRSLKLKTTRNYGRRRLFTL